MRGGTVATGRRNEATVSATASRGRAGRRTASKHKGTAPATLPDAHGNHGQDEGTTPTLSTHRIIDIADITRQATRTAAADSIPHRTDKNSKPHTPANTTSPRSSTREAGREAKR